jgi:hypothetical protein
MTQRQNDKKWEVKKEGGEEDQFGCATTSSRDEVLHLFFSYHWVQGSPLPEEVWNPWWVPHLIRLSALHLRSLGAARGWLR